MFRLIMLMLGVSMLKACVNVPTWFPAVTEILLVPRTPWLIKALTEVSDSQDVRSVEVWPIRMIKVYAACPKFAPCTVMLADPVPARFTRRRTLKEGMSCDIISVIVQATCRSIVNVIYFVPPTPAAVLHRIVLSATHSVTSQADPSMRCRGVGSKFPKLSPATVRLTEPVPGAL